MMSLQQIRWYITYYPTGVGTGACNDTSVEKYACAFDVQSRLDSSSSVTFMRPDRNAKLHKLELTFPYLLFYHYVA